MSQTFTATKMLHPELGKEVLALRCSNPEMECLILPELGFNIIQWSYRGKLIFSYDKGTLLRPSYTGCPVLFPFPNRVRDASYTFQGRSYRQRKDGKPITLHSLVWDEPFQARLEHGEDFAKAQGSIAFDNPRLLEGYPFPCTLTVTCTLRHSGLTVSYEVCNDGTRTMPFGFALHPYFYRVDGEDTYVRIPAAKRYETTPDLLPTGRLLPVEGPYDLNSPVSSSARELDDVYCELEGPCAIIHKRSGFEIRMLPTPDFQHVVCYITQELPDLFCVENQTCSTDAVNLHESCATSNLMTLAPAKSHRGQVEFVIQPL